MGNLHQLLAVKKDTATRANEVLQETKKVFGSKHLFYGSLKAYQSIEDEGEMNIPEEAENLSYTIGEKLAWFADEFGRHVDVEYQIDLSNERAYADVTVPGLSLGGIPATFLLELASFLEKVRKVYATIPVLDPKYKWETDSQKGNGVFQISEPEETYRTKKVHQHKILVEPTKEHPAQIREWTEDQQVGKYVKRIWSGAITAHQKALILGRIDVLLVAAKKALSEANNAEHVNDKIADRVFNYLHDGIPTEGILRDV